MESAGWQPRTIQSADEQKQKGPCSARKVTHGNMLNAREPPELSSEERAARELVKRIRKLRWLGMEEEARWMQAALSRLPPGESVLLLPANTD
jgi:hypothetical protein